MKTIELCEHNLADAQNAAAAAKLEAALAGKANINTVSCIHSCKACHAGALIVRVGEEVITDPDHDVVITQVKALI